MLDGPVAQEVNGLRRALGDRALGRIEPHITLVPPVNVAARDVPAALEIVRRAAAACGRPLTMILGPPGTFAPDNPVVHLPVSGDLDPLRRLRDAVFAGPLHRSLSWPWVPHVTLADDADPAGIGSTLSVLRHYEAVTVVDRVVVLEERRRPVPLRRRWEAFADAALAPGVVVGRGGLDLVVVRGRVLAPDAAALLAEAGYEAPGVPVADAGYEVSGTEERDPLVVTGLIDSALAGVAVAWRTDAGGRIVVTVARARRGRGVGRQLLMHTEAAVRSAGWDCPVLAAPGPSGFYTACSRWSVTSVDGR